MTGSRLIPTPGQTVGPFFGHALPYDGGEHLVPPGHPAAVRITGRVLDGRGDGVPDALLEIWQADAAGQVSRRPGAFRRDGRFTGWGRAATDGAGRYGFTTIPPGPCAEGRPPFIAMTVFARGLMNGLFTRVYVPGHEGSHAGDPLLASLRADRRRTMVAVPEGTGWRFDVRLQGDGETVFLRYPGQWP